MPLTYDNENYKNDDGDNKNKKDIKNDKDENVQFDYGVSYLDNEENNKAKKVIVLGLGDDGNDLKVILCLNRYFAMDAGRFHGVK